MDRREFIKWGSAGLMTLVVSGCAFFTADTAKTADSAPSSTPVSGGKSMKITVITGSPHKAGTSALLADKFIEGAQSAGHEVYRFNAAFEDTHPCLGCDRCGMNGPCVYSDAIENNLMPQMLASDMIVLVTPLYYWGMSAQLKTVVDRFYARSGALHGKKSILMATAYNSDDWTMDSLTAHYDRLVSYMNWTDVGRVLAIGCGSRPLIERSEFPNRAYQLGASI